MARYINADILAKIVFDKWQERDELKHIIPAIRNAIMCASTADVRENVHAHWEGDGQCSNCKDYPLARYMRNPNFCPNCGAQMDEEEFEITEEYWHREEWMDEWDERKENE